MTRFRAMMMGWRAAACGLGMLMLSGCTTPEPRPSVRPPGGTTGPSEWAAQTLPGKRETLYRPADRQGRPCIQAQAERSASLWRRRVDAAQAGAQRLRFSWWAADLDDRASVTDPDHDDAVARVVLGFEGDLSRLSARNRALFELVHTLTGEAPPYATLMYVWDARAPVGTVIVSGRTDRIRKIVVESGRRPLNTWRHHERDVRADFELAFGEPSGSITTLAYMTDADNMQGHAEACYGPVELF
ncbi:MAG: hypothetical protein RLZZ592_1914 [Pseudomonadota bacterium]|jgi:hypothetical protein